MYRTMMMHVTQLTPEAALQHARRCCGLEDKPAVGIGWRPYQYLVTDRAISQWACYDGEFEAECRRRGLVVVGWSDWREGIRYSQLTMKGATQ